MDKYFTNKYNKQFYTKGRIKESKKSGVYSLWYTYKYSFDKWEDLQR